MICIDEKRRKKQQQEEASNAFKYDYEGNSQSDIQRKLAAQYKTAADMPLVIFNLSRDHG